MKQRPDIAEFLSQVSQELRSPLLAIEQCSSILLGGLAGELNPEQRGYQETVLKNIRQLRGVIEDVLEVSRLDNGQLTLEPERVDICGAVTDAIDALKETARFKGISLWCNLPPDLPAAHADLTRLRQILGILLENAITFTSDAGAVSVRAGLLQDDPRFLLFEVSDSGCGIHPEIAERIFDRKGLGLGLQFCKQLVTRQGGRIWVQSSQENGTIFSFTLPVFPMGGTVAPVSSGRWPAESVAIVMVEVGFQDAWPSSESQEEWSRETRSRLERNLLPDIDVLVPKINTGAAGEHFCFVAAVVDERGAAAVADRIRAHFERLPQAHQPRVTVSVSYRMMQTVSPATGASMNSMVAAMAAALEVSINSHVISEVV